MSDMNWSDLLNNAGDSSFEPLPPGEYDVDVASAEARKSQKGKKMYALKMRVANGPFEGRTVWTQLVVSPENANALGIFFRHMAVLGLDADFFQSNPSDSQVEKALEGAKARIQVGQREWQGQQRNDVKNITQSPRGANEPKRPGQEGVPQISDDDGPEPF